MRRETITVSELKEIIKDWPETDENGEPTEVWIETGRDLTSAVVEAGRLYPFHLLLHSQAFENDPPVGQTIDKEKGRQFQKWVEDAFLGCIPKDPENVMFEGTGAE